MRSTKIVSISLPEQMLSEAEALAKEENRTMSELVREALRAYKREREGWRALFEVGKARGSAAGVKNEEDVVQAVREVRKQKRLKTGTRSIRVVFDTNIFVSALVYGGPPEALLLAATAGAFPLDLPAPQDRALRGPRAV